MQDMFGMLIICSSFKTQMQQEVIQSVSLSTDGQKTSINSDFH